MLPVLLFAASIGLVLGMLGGGGAILAMPILLYVAHVPARVAITMSLIVVGATSLVGAAAKARAGDVRWKEGLGFAAAGMSGAFLGARVTAHVPPFYLVIGFAVLMLVSAFFMIRPVKPNRPEARPLLVLPVGLASGFITGAVGAGGGFIVVPALVLVLGVPMRQAVGTSLVVIALQSFAGAAGQLMHVQINWTLAAGMVLASSLGVVAGSLGARRAPQQHLRRGFAALMVIAAGYIGVRQLIDQAHAETPAATAKSADAE